MANHEQELYDKLSAGNGVKPEVEERRGEPDSSKPVTLRNLFTSPDTHPVVLDFALLKLFQADWYLWEGETVEDEVKDTFGTRPSTLCGHKIRALQALHATELPWTKWQVFEKVAVTFNNILPDPKILQLLPLEDLYAAVDIISNLRKEEYSDEVKLYMAATVLHEEVFFVPPPLDFIQLEVSQPHYRCNDCGNAEPSLFSDGYCTNCSGRMHPEQGLTLEPRRELVNAGKGKNTSLEVRYDPLSVMELWKKESGRNYQDFVKEPRFEDPDWVQVEKLLLAREYMNLRRKQLAEQLTGMKGWLGAPV